MEADAILPDLQSCVLCEDVRFEINGMQTLVGVINVIPAPLHQRDQIQSRMQLMGSDGAGMTLITPTRVCMPLISQRTSSQSTQLCRSGRITVVSISRT